MMNLSLRPLADLRRGLPFLAWLPGYRRGDLPGDLAAGLVVAIMLVPQSMAYALLAGMPPQAGLYVSILPMAVYGLLGSSRVLSVGPTAMSAILVAAGLGKLTGFGSPDYLALALMLALLVGAIQIGMGLLRAGFLVNFLSHPVLAGFTNAAALVIAVSQIGNILGIRIPRSEHFYDTLWYAATHIGETRPAAALIGLGSVVILLALRRIPGERGVLLRRIGPLLVVAAGTLLTWGLSLDSRAGLGIVGKVPAGLPPLALPAFDADRLGDLLPLAVTVSLISYMESISSAKALASKRRQKIDPNQELIALGAANVSASLTGGYPVSGGLSRSIVNFASGANTGLAAIITAGLIALVLLFVTPVFYYLPNAVLAAIILVAVSGLVDVAALRQAWRYNKADALSMLVTFGGVLFLGVERGIFAGVGVSIGLFLWRTSRPHMAVVGRVGDSEHFRNVRRHAVRTCPHIHAVRVDESLYFANAQYLQDSLLNQLVDCPDVKHVVLVCSAVNFIDSSALASLLMLVDELRGLGITFHLAEVKGPVMDRLEAIGFIERLGAGRVFQSTHQAMEALGCPAA